MNPKKVVLIGIAACAISVLLMSPALANGDDYILGIYGNANEDDTIDMRDLTYVKLIFFGKKTETELANAKYDGKINPLDFIQIKLIIVGKEKELTIVDTADRIVTVKKPVERIIPSLSTNLEFMRSLNVNKDRIVGVDEYTTKNDIFFPEFSDYPSVGTSTSLDIEKILRLNPDVVLLGAYQCLRPKYEYEKLLKIFEDADIAAFCFYCYEPESYVEETIKLGYILNKKEEAEKFVEFYEGCLSTIKESVVKIPEDERPRVYFEYWKPYHTAGGNTGYHQKLEVAGGNNIFSDLSYYPEISPEEVIKRDPEIIVSRIHHGGGYDVDDVTELKAVRDEIMGRSELEKVPAVKNKRVYIVCGPLSGPEHFVGMAYLAKWFYPDLFSDFDPKAIYQEYLTEFQGLDYDLDKHGVFVYPEPS